MPIKKVELTTIIREEINRVLKESAQGDLQTRLVKVEELVSGINEFLDGIEPAVDFERRRPFDQQLPLRLLDVLIKKLEDAALIVRKLEKAL